MKPLWIIFLAALLGVSASAEVVRLNDVRVIVNDAVITYQDVWMAIGPEMESLEMRYGNQPLVLRQKKADLLAEGIEHLVERQIILHDFKTAGYNMPESIIDDTIQERIKQQYGDRATLTKTLKAEGSTFERYRQRTREQIIIEQLRYMHVSKEVIISPQKIRDYYEANKTNYAIADEVKLRMIRLDKPPGGGGMTKQLAEEILSKIKEGATFEEMARIHSDGPQRATGGDSAWIERSKLQKDLAEAAARLQKGQYSGVIDLPDYCFLMLMEDVRPAHTKPLADVRDDIEKNLIVQERARLQKKWIDRLKAKSFIRYFPD